MQRGNLIDERKMERQRLRNIVSLLCDQRFHVMEHACCHYRCFYQVKEFVQEEAQLVAGEQNLADSVHLDLCLLEFHS